METDGAGSTLHEISTLWKAAEENVVLARAAQLAEVQLRTQCTPLRPAGFWSFIKADWVHVDTFTEATWETLCELMQIQHHIYTYIYIH